MSLVGQIGPKRTTQDITSEIPLNFFLDNEKITGKASINNGTIPINLFSSSGFIVIKDY